jgi:hypothetical protein
MKLIYKASDINEANIVSGMLRANGIEAHVGGFYLQGGVGNLAATDFATIHVPDEDIELARSLIAEYESASIINDTSAAKRKRANFLLSVILFVIIIIAIFYYFVG